MADSYATALAGRRGRGMDASQMIASDMDTDVGLGQGFNAGGPMDAHPELGMKDPGHANVDTRAGIDDVPPDVKNVGADLKTPSDMQPAPVRHENSGAPEPASQSMGEGGGELGSEIRDAVTGHASQGEYELLKGMRPRSLGERAKMDALKSKFEPGGK